MKRLIILSICWLCLLSFSLAIPVAAIEVSPEDVSTERREEILDNLDVAVLDVEIIERSICCFDVNEDGRFAVGLDESRSRRRVQIYDAGGNYQYGYEFLCSGSFWIEFKGDELTIFMVRGSLAITLSPEGRCVSVKEYSGSAGDMLYITEKVCGDRVYSMERDVGFTWAFSRLVVTDTDGIRQILYDETWVHNVGVICCYATVVVFVVAWIFVMVKQSKKKETETDCHTSVRTGSQ